ncbi:hypothetical protein [Nitrosospira sp. Is2]|uniref:hypothetical protein n=1 Tax=Nitrosospira sp. Is2 TaxID=3080532 RepID=UPI002952F53D|nr:hypothetical protein [Nitrosospira sp. Is2]WON75312.1 hypothetical protein R5L00_07510 [Nitrosospira sp. Is2]
MAERERKSLSFPDWAPKNLVERYHHYPHPREYGDDMYPPCPFDPDQHIDQLRKESAKFNQMSKQQQDNYRTSLNRSEFGLPPEVGKELLGTLLTDLRMAPVWSSLGKKIKEGAGFLYFWDQCQRSVLGWLGGQKRSSKEHEAHFLKIHHLALELSLAMNDTEEFQNFSAAELTNRVP